MLKKINIYLLAFGLFATSSTFAEEVEIKNQEIKSEGTSSVDVVQEQPKEEKLTASQRIRIKLDEKKRLRSIAERRNESNLKELELSSFFLNNLKYDDLVKSMFREALFYIKLMKDNSNDEELLKKESENILWNIICLSNNTSKENYSVTFTFLVEQNIKTDEDKANFAKANETVFKHISEMDKITKEEIILRCLEVYGKNN